MSEKCILIDVMSRLLGSTATDRLYLPLGLVFKGNSSTSHLEVAIVKMITPTAAILVLGWDVLALWILCLPVSFEDQQIFEAKQLCN
jgi:hypothetical protein